MKPKFRLPFVLMRKRTIVIAVLFSLVISLFGPLAGTSTILPYEGQLSTAELSQLDVFGITPGTEGIAMAEMAWRVAQSRPHWFLRWAGLKNDVSLQHAVWSFVWSADDQRAVKVKIDADTGQLLYYLDITGVERPFEHVEWRISRGSAILSAVEFIEQYVELPSDTESLSVKRDQDGWMVEWTRFVDGLKVRSDYVRVLVNPISGCVTGFAMKRTTTFKPEPVTLDEQKILIHAKRLGLTRAESRSDVNLQLEWVCPKDSPDTAILAWVVATEKGEFWLSTQDASVLRDGRYLICYHGLSVNTDGLNNDPGDQFFNIMDYVYDIMDAELPSANYINIPTENQWKGASSNYVFFSAGHGSIVGTNNRIHIAKLLSINPEEWDETYVYASEINNVPLRRLVYLMHCRSGWYSAGHEEDAVAYQFMWNSKRHIFEEMTIYENAVIGFTGLIYSDDAIDFTEVFWDCLADGDTVGEAKATAKLSNPTTGNQCVIFGDTSVTLEG